MRHISALAAMKRILTPLADGVYEQVILKNKEYVFKRKSADAELFVILNIEDGEVTHNISCVYTLFDLETGDSFESENGMVSITTDSCRSRVLGSEKMMGALQNGLCCD